MAEKLALLQLNTIHNVCTNLANINTLLATLVSKSQGKKKLLLTSMTSIKNMTSNTLESGISGEGLE